MSRMSRIALSALISCQVKQAEQGTCLTFKSKARPLRQFRLSPFLFYAALLTCTAGSAQVFTQQGSKLVGSGAVGDAEQGASAALSADGNTALVGGP